MRRVMQQYMQICAYRFAKSGGIITLHRDWCTFVLCGWEQNNKANIDVLPLLLLIVMWFQRFTVAFSTICNGGKCGEVTRRIFPGIISFISDMEIL